MEKSWAAMLIISLLYKTIEKCGGKFTAVRHDTAGSEVHIYWIDL